jgi:gamma-glutamylcyclotransferase (GGCT)/AIG2-like uncharacterized protein YtfP
MKYPLVFVYGTLKRGYGNHHLLMEEIFLGEGETEDDYHLQGDSIPYAVPSAYVPKGTIKAPIKGEIYHVVNPKTMRQLDILEGNGHFYFRNLRKVTLEDKEILNAYIYEIPRWQDKRASCPLVNGKFVWMRNSARRVG